MRHTQNNCSCPDRPISNHKRNRVPICYLRSGPRRRRRRRRVSKKCPEICPESQQKSFKPSPSRIGQVSISQQLLVLAAGGAAGRRRISKKCAEICSESHQKSFKPSPTRIGQVSVSQPFRNFWSSPPAAPPAAGGFPKNVQKFVRRVTSSRLSHRRPESDKYLFRNYFATFGPRRRRRRRPPSDFQKNVQKFVRRVTRSRLSHRRPESDKYLFRNYFATFGPRRRRDRKSAVEGKRVDLGGRRNITKKT